MKRMYRCWTNSILDEKSIEKHVSICFYYLIFISIETVFQKNGHIFFNILSIIIIFLLINNHLNP